ncbi:hypothetical protein GOV12_07855 [Candidatus Pacearchaeota archaeon]|nr:hypothetical protein [Candidatus Pacearchaeota archaeon]
MDEKITEKIDDLTKEDELEILKKMCYIRDFEKELIKAFNNNCVHTPIYLSIGQEAISATISRFFKPDLIFGQHRGHSTYLAFGGDKVKIIDELLGMETGCCCGRGGSPPVQDENIGMVGHHGLIGENVPLAVGAALGDKSKKIYCVFGDGAAEEDYVFTSIGFALTHKLPVLFICEDNDLSILTKKCDRRNWELSDALKGIGMPSVDISDDPAEISHYINKFKDNLPAFINIRTCRHHWHTGVGVDNVPEQDRLELFKNKLINEGKRININEICENVNKEVKLLWQERLEKQ